MNEILSSKLLDDFPKLFRNRHESSMQRGFECGDGWFDLIYKLAQDIETVARDCGLTPDSPEWPLCRQVKQKLGSLRFVVFGTNAFSGMHERISELRNDALDHSLKICEYCGKPADLASDIRIHTMCPEHARQATIDPEFPPPFQLGKYIIDGNTENP